MLPLSTEPGIRITGLGKSLGSGWKPWKSLSAPATQYSSPALGTEEEGVICTMTWKERVKPGPHKAAAQAPGSRMRRSGGPGMERPGLLPSSKL